MSKPSDSSAVSVEEYVGLLEKHQGSSHRFIHQLFKNGPDLTEEYRQYIHSVAAQFRISNAAERASNLSSENESGGAGALTEPLKELVAKLDLSDRTGVLRELEAHAAYLKELASQSTARTAAVIEASSATKLGPGMFLALWQALLDATLITPAAAAGEVRKGGSMDVRNAARLDTDGEQKGGGDGEDERAAEEILEPPDVSNTVRLLSRDYKEMLRKMSASR